jgi:hypothetical protein
MRSLTHDFAQARQHHLRPGTLEEYLRLLRPSTGFKRPPSPAGKWPDWWNHCPEGQAGTPSPPSPPSASGPSRPDASTKIPRKGSRSRPLRAKLGESEPTASGALRHSCSGRR